MCTGRTLLLLPSFLFVYLLLTPAFGQSQDWKSLYEQAKSAYEAENYPEALGAAVKAYSLSKQDEHQQAPTAQLITAICVANHQPDDGLKYIEEEALLFKKLEGDKSKAFEGALQKHALLLQQKGLTRDALIKCEAALSVCKVNEGEESLEYATLQALRGQLFLSESNWAKAKESLDQSLVKLAKFPDAGEEYLDALKASASADGKLGDFTSAEKKYRQLILILEKNNLQNTEDYPAAKKALEEVLAAGNKGGTATAGKEEDDANRLLKAAIGFQNQGQDAQAIENYQQAVTILQAGHLESNTAFSVYLNYGRLLLEQRKPAEATGLLTKASELSKKLYATGSAEEGYVYFALGDLALAQGKMTAALGHYQKVSAATIASSPILIKLCNNAAIKLLNNDQASLVIALLQPMVTDAGLLSTLPEKDQPLIAIPYCKALTQTGRNKEAIERLTKSMTVATTGDTKIKYQLELADAYKAHGEWKKALQILTDGKASAANKEMQAEVTYQIARLNQQLGEYGEAEKNYRLAIELYGALQPAKPKEQLQVYNSLAILYTQLGNYEQATVLYQNLIKQTDKQSPFYVTLQQNLAGVYIETLQYQPAMKILETVTILDKNRFGDHHPDYAVSLQNLAAVYQKSGNLERAKELYAQALQIDQDNGGDANLTYATKAANLGVVYMEMNNLAQSKILLEKALQIREKALGKEHPDYIFNEYNLAVLFQRMNDATAAVPLFRHVSLFYMKQIQELFPAMSEKEKTAFYNKINEVILAYQDFMIENGVKQKELVGELLNFRLATKALLLNSSVKIRNRILASGDAMLQQHFEEWLQTKEELGKLYSLNLEERQSNGAKIEALQQKANESEKWLNAQSELFARNASENTPADWKAIKSKLKADEAAIEMIRLKMNLKNDSVIYAALVIKPELEMPAMIVLPNGRQMEGREFSYYRNSILFKQQNIRSYDVYWKAIEPTLKNTKVLYFSADGVFNKINLSTLYQPQTKTFLVDELTIKQLSSLRELLGTPAKATGKTASLLGYPDFRLGSSPSLQNVTPTTRAIIGTGIPELPGTKEEINKINDILIKSQWTTHLYVSAEATEKAIKDQQNTGVIHIATHGFFIPAEGDDQVVLAHDIDQVAHNPLLRSGLIMSGAEKYLTEAPSKRGADDGILTAYEVMNLNIEKTGLVVLSACETGAGEIKNGEGVYGLQRAFLVAGTQNLLMSLWKVDDEATQELMVEFYKQWNQTNDKTLAFRNTQLAMKKKYGEPYFWGGFVMVGNN